MKVIVAGSRSITSFAEVENACIRSGFVFTEVISGAARGVDTLGERFASKHKLAVRRFPADWQKFGRRAGYIRNSEMAEYAEALVLVWDGQSSGSKHMLASAKEKKLPCFVVVVP